MPLGKYYCDYCDKQFQDTLFARKRHLQALQHLRAKASWYDSFNEPKILAFTDGFGKGVCNRFLKTGFCQYGDSCKYFHPKNTSQNSSVRVVTGWVDNNPSSNISGKQLNGSTPFPGSVIGDGMRLSWGNLPPSLKPPPEGGYSYLPFVDWG